MTEQFDYEQREAYLAQEELRRDNDARMREGPVDPLLTALEPESPTEQLRAHVKTFLQGCYRLRLTADGNLSHHKEGEYVLWSEIEDFINSLTPEDEYPIPHMTQENNSGNTN